MINKDRLMAITDGIVAIAATIMVLSLSVPERLTFMELRHNIPIFMAYIISFVQVFLSWHEHHDAIRDAQKINHRIFMLNAVWLFFITLIPYATGVVGNAYDDAFSVRFYILILFCVDASIKFLCDLVVKINQHDIVDSEVIHFIRRITFAGYVIAFVITFIQPGIALAVIILEYIFNIIVMWLYDIKINEGR